MTLNPTEEQTSIIDAARDTSDNLLVSALAGAAKTSTLELVAKELPDIQILYLVFNKKNAIEAQARLPSNCTAMTLNSIGHRTWSEAIGKRLRVESSKTYDILSAYLQELSPEEKSFAFSNMSDLMKTIDFGKACGYIPTGHYEKAKRLMDDDDFFNHLDEYPSDLEVDIVRECTLRSLKQSFEGLIDYNDQILMPTVFHGAFPRFPLVLVDESQDLSALNHATLTKLVKKRIIAVGDQCQAIYGFRGAHQDGMAALKKKFEMRELTLSVSFRCPQEVVKAARWRAPHMKWPEWAKVGEVSSLSRWDAQILPDEAAIICRNNSPLFSLAIKLLKNGRYSEMKNDIGKGLLKIMKKFGPSSLKQDKVLIAIDAWEAEKVAKAKPRAHGGIKDRADCMRIFAAQGENLGDSIAYAEHLFNSRGPLKLMTGHGSKGLEFDHVYFLEADLVGEDEQERNLRYVIITRAKETLTYINMEGFEDTEAQ